MIVLLSGCVAVDAHLSGTNLVASHQPIDETATSFPVRMVGLVDVIYDRDDSQQYFEAGFIQFTEPVDSEIVFSTLKPKTSLACTFQRHSSRSDGPIVTPEYLAFPQAHTRVSAGKSLQVHHNGKRYAGMSYEKDNSGDYYDGGRGGQLITFNTLRLGEVLLRSSSLSLTIPGDVFPAFRSVHIPAEPKIVDLRINNRHGLSSDSKVSWSNPNSSNTWVRFFAGGSGKALNCILPDNGSFTPQEPIRTEIGNSTLHVVDAARERIEFYREKDALLAIAHRSWMSARKQ